MLKAKCIEKMRDKNNLIIAYKLQDTQGNTKTVSPQQLKQAIKTNKIDIINLKLTSDNRLINNQFNKKLESKPTNIVLKREYIINLNNQNNKSLSFKIKVNLSNLLKKSKLLGYTTQKLEDHLYLLESNTQLIIVTDLAKISLPADCSNLFERSSLKSIDFTNIDTSNVTSMSYMFSRCQAQQLDLSSFNTQNVTNMAGMFHNCQDQHLDLSSFNTQNVTDMSGMFNDCQAQHIDLSSFNTQKVTDMSYMFCECQAQQLDLYSLNTKNVIDMSYMFCGCQAQHLDLSSFNTENVTNMSWMFCKCQSQQIDLSSFNTQNVTNMYCMLYDGQAQKIIIHSKEKKSIINNKEAFKKCKALIEIKE